VGWPEGAGEMRGLRVDAYVREAGMGVSVFGARLAVLASSVRWAHELDA
jgi:hypothetical protein